jgi:transposase
MGISSEWKKRPAGRPTVINERYINYLYELLESGPRSCGYAFSRWTVQWLNKHLSKELGIVISDRHLKRLLKDLGWSTLSKPDRSSLPHKNNRIHIADISPTYLVNELELIGNNLLQPNVNLKIYNSKFTQNIS